MIMRSFVFCAVAVSLGAVTSTTLADTACNSLLLADPQVFFCDDFDRYCTSPPSDPTMPCTPPSTGGKADGRLRNTWVPSSTGVAGGGALCGTQFTVEEETSRLVSAPYGGRYPCQGDAQLGQQTVDLIQEIQAKFGAQYSTVIGTDAAPLILFFMMNAGNCANVNNCNLGIQYETGYMELGLDSTPGAQTDWIRVGMPEGENCISCFSMCPGPHFSVHVPWPTICQSYVARTASPSCPPAQTGIRNALAVGCNALLDNNPCHCEMPSDQVPNNPRLSFYDGHKWRIIGKNQVRPPDETTPPVYIEDATYTGDFVMGSKFNNVTLTVYSNTVDIELVTRTPATVDPNHPIVRSKVTGIKRKYLGAFNKLRGGFKDGCELNNGSYTCAGNRRCLRTGDTRCDGNGFTAGKSGNIAFDNVFVKGGGPNVQTGACCLGNTNCLSDVTAQDCAAVNGQFRGLLSTCANQVCCPAPIWADADTDGDVDHNDFGEFQGCFTGSSTGVTGQCTCFDRDNDNDVDADDLAKFTNCVSGPNVPWAPGAPCVP